MGRIRQLFDNEQVLQPDSTGFFTPDTELALKLIQQKDKDLDDLEDLRGKLQEKLAIAHMDTANDTREARDLLESYQHEADNIATMAMNDRLNTGLYKRYLHDLQGRMVKDMQSGRWYDLTKRAADEKAWKEQNAHILKEDPTLYNRIYDRYMQEHEDLGRKYAEEGVSSWRVPWQAIVPKPNLTSDQMLKAYSLAKENMWDEQRGMYIYKNTEISEEEAGRIALNSLLSDANFYGYAAQQARLGDKGYLNDEGEIIPPMIIDSHGKPQWNPRSAFAPDLQLVQDIIAHKQQHITPDQVKIAAANRAAASMRGGGRGKEEPAAEPPVEYLGRVPNEQIDLDEMNETANRVKHSASRTANDVDEMENISAIQQQAGLRFVTPEGEEITFGQLGVRDGLGWNYDKGESRELSFGDGREPISYIPANTVEQRMEDMSRVIDSLDKSQLRAMMYAKAYSTSDRFNPMNRAIGFVRSIEGISDEMAASIAAEANAHGSVRLNDSNAQGRYRVSVTKSKMLGHAYSKNDVDKIEEFLNDPNGLFKIKFLAKALRSTTNTKFANEPYVRHRGLMMNKKEDLKEYAKQYARQIGLDEWHVDNNPILASLLPAGQQEPISRVVFRHAGSKSYSQGRIDDGHYSLLYSGINSSTDKFLTSVASNNTIALKNVVADHNDKVHDIPIVRLESLAKRNISEQLGFLAAPDTKTSTAFTAYENGSVKKLTNDDCQKLINSIGSDDAVIGATAGSPRGDLMLTITPAEVEINGKIGGTYQLVPSHPSHTAALMRLVLQGIPEDTPSRRAFKSSTYRMLQQKLSGRDVNQSGSIVAVVPNVLPSYEVVPCTKVFYDGVYYYLHGCNEMGALCSNDGKAVQLKGMSEFDYVKSTYNSGIGFKTLEAVNNILYPESLQ